jgi:hypothetical protein
VCLSAPSFSINKAFFLPATAVLQPFILKSVLTAIAL